MNDQGKKILIVEDEPFIFDVYSHNLQNAGYFVQGVPDGVEAIDTLKKNQFDLVLLDIMLPKMNGFQMLKQVQEEKIAPNTPIILLTNLSSEEMIKEGFVLGAKGYLIKSAFTPLELVAEVNNYLSGAKTNLINIFPSQP